MNIEQFVVADDNTAQAEAWDGDEGAQWAAHAEFFDRNGPNLSARLLDAAAIGGGERVLDLGCGNGQSTCDAARAAAPGDVVGIDLSSAMLDVGRERAADAGLTNASFVHGDAQVYPFDPAGFDVAISRFGTMFFGDQVAAFTNVNRALRAGGRLVLMSWRPPDLNEWLTEIVSALTLGRPAPLPPAGAQGPFGHADPQHTAGILHAAGFADADIEPVDDQVYMGADAGQAFEIVSELFGWMTSDHSDAEKAEAFAALRAVLEAHETPEGVAFGAAAWLITATA